MPNYTNTKTVLIDITYANRTLNWFTNFDIGSDPDVIHQLCKQIFGGDEEFMEYEFDLKQGYLNWSLIGLNENKTRAETGHAKSID